MVLIGLYVWLLIDEVSEIKFFNFVFFIGLDLFGERTGELDETDETGEGVVDVDIGEIDDSTDLSIFDCCFVELFSIKDFGDKGCEEPDVCCWCCWFEPVRFDEDVVEEEEDGEPVFVLFNTLVRLWLNSSFSSLRHLARRFENQTCILDSCKRIFFERISLENASG